MLEIILVVLVGALFYGRSQDRARLQRVEKSLQELRGAIPASALVRGAEKRADESEEPNAREAEKPGDLPEDAKDIGIDEGDSQALEPDEDAGRFVDPVEGFTAGEDPALAAAAARAERKREKPKRKKIDWERQIGERWTVLLGGLALALGAIFLVRYSITSGLLGPAARIGAGAVLSLALFAGGEWLRRNDKLQGIPVMDKADVPGILTGVGAIAAFSTLYAAHALYGFIGPAVAFVGLTLIGIATLLLSSIHGPKLAAIGVLGAYASPLLVSSNEPNPLPVALHIVAVTATVLVIARIRHWAWLAFAGIAGAAMLSVLIATVGHAAVSWVAGGLLIALALLYSVIFCLPLLTSYLPTNAIDAVIEPDAQEQGEQGGQGVEDASESTAPDWVGLTAFISLSGLLVFYPAVLATFPLIPVSVVVSLIITASAIYYPPVASSVLAVGAAISLAVLGLDLKFAEWPGVQQTEDLKAFMRPRDIEGFIWQAGMLAVPMIALCVWGVRHWAMRLPHISGWLATGASIVGFFAPLFVYLRISPFETATGFGFACMLLSLGFISLTEYSNRLAGGNTSAPAPVAFVVAAAGLLSLGLGVILSAYWLPLGFALMALMISVIYGARPLLTLPWLAFSAGILGAVALYFNAPFPASEIGTTPFLNGLIVVVGLPAFCLLAAGEVLARNSAKTAGSLLTVLGLAAAGLFVGLQLRHWLHDGVIIGSPFGLADMGVHVTAALFGTIGLQRVSGLRTSKVYDYASFFLGVVSILVALFALGVWFNPFFSNIAISGGMIFNTLTAAYLLNAILAGLVALFARDFRPRWYTLSYAALGGVLLFLFTSGQTRLFFQGKNIGFWQFTTDMEFWAYSAVWLALGVLTLAIGFVFASRPIRMASVALIGLTVCKVFLLDMAELEGPLRAFSFLGLGACLLAIGRYYQRLLRADGEPAAAGGPIEPDTPNPVEDQADRDKKKD